MSFRRTVLACAVTFACALAVFTLPRFAWNSLQGAVRPQPAPESVVSPSIVAPPVTQAAPRSVGQRLTGLFGIVLILGIGMALSRNRRAISWRIVAWGLGLQLAFAIFVLRVPLGQKLFSALGDVVKQILSFSYVGSEFVFGEIGKQHSSLGVIFAFQVLPAIIFVSALFAILYYLGIMQLVVEAAARGTTDGLHLMLNVIAMLVSFIALVALGNGVFGWVHGYATWFPENIQTVLGWVFSPIAWVMGVPWHDSGTIGSLLGTRMVLNEFIAYAQLGPMKPALDPVSFTIATFALCGFANISSVGIQIGGIGALVPDRKHDLARLGFRAMIAGTLANFLSATLAGMLL